MNGRLVGHLVELGVFVRGSRVRSDQHSGSEK